MPPPPPQGLMPSVTSQRDHSKLSLKRAWPRFRLKSHVATSTYPRFHHLFPSCNVAYRSRRERDGDGAGRSAPRGLRHSNLSPQRQRRRRLASPRASAERPRQCRGEARLEGARHRYRQAGHPGHASLARRGKSRSCQVLCVPSLCSCTRLRERDSEATPFVLCHCRQLLAADGSHSSDSNLICLTRATAASTDLVCRSLNSGRISLGRVQRCQIREMQVTGRASRRT